MIAIRQKLAVFAFALPTALMAYGTPGFASDVEVNVLNTGRGDVSVEVVVKERNLPQPRQIPVPQPQYASYCFASNAYTGRWQQEALVVPVPVGSPCVFSPLMTLKYGFAYGTAVAG